MPQGALNTSPAKKLNGGASPLSVDGGGALSVGRGVSNMLNKTGTFVVKAAAGRICRINVTGGTAANITINDCATTGAATTANVVAAIQSANAAVGTTIDIDFPCAAGIVVQAGTAVVAVSFA